MNQLDALRAIAVFAVMFFHLFQVGQEGIVQFGLMGIDLFFVLSGFLITGILLKSRLSGNSKYGKRKQLKIFYTRRFLRIFPLYYLVVIGATLFGIRGTHDSFLWNISYTSNIYYAFRHSWGGSDSHFWTLSIEEQFYLLWPLFMLSLPDKFIMPLIISSILLAIAFRFVIFFWDLNVFWGFLLFPRLDSLALGSLLAFFQYKRPEEFKNITNNRLYDWVGIALFIVVLVTGWARIRFPFLGFVGNTAMPLFFVWLIHRAALGFKGMTGRILNARFLKDCGRISYGLYVFHPFVQELLPKLFQKFHVDYPDNSGLQGSLLVIVSIVVATISWNLIEKPINNLKAYFPY